MKSEDWRASIRDTVVEIMAFGCYSSLMRSRVGSETFNVSMQYGSEHSCLMRRGRVFFSSLVLVSIHQSVHLFQPLLIPFTI